MVPWSNILFFHSLSFPNGFLPFSELILSWGCPTSALFLVHIWANGFSQATLARKELWLASLSSPPLNGGAGRLGLSVKTHTCGTKERSLWVLCSSMRHFLSVDRDGWLISRNIEGEDQKGRSFFFFFLTCLIWRWVIYCTKWLFLGFDYFISWADRLFFRLCCHLALSWIRIRTCLTKG